MSTIRKATAKLPKGWKKGAPPHVGFWKIRCSGDDWPIFTGLQNEWSWWDGKTWSYASSPLGSSTSKLDEATSYKHRPDSFEYNYAWPKSARVARINPKTGECTGTGPCPYEADGKAWPFKGKP